MAPAGKFVLNKRTVADIAKNDRALGAALVSAAEEMRAEAGPTATIDKYTTDRQVAGIVVGAAEQARDGVATKAAQSVASKSGGKERGFRSRAQWRWYSLNRPADAARMRRVQSYASLPERVKR